MAETVRLKSTVGPVTLHWRISPGTPEINFTFSLDNDNKCEVPVEFWEPLADLPFADSGKLYRQAFKAL